MEVMEVEVESEVEVERIDRFELGTGKLHSYLPYVTSCRIRSTLAVTTVVDVIWRRLDWNDDFCISTLTFRSLLFSGDLDLGTLYRGTSTEVQVQTNALPTPMRGSCCTFFLLL